MSVFFEGYAYQFNKLAKDLSNEQAYIAAEYIEKGFDLRDDLAEVHPDPEVNSKFYQQLGELSSAFIENLTNPSKSEEQQAVVKKINTLREHYGVWDYRVVCNFLHTKHAASFSDSFDDWKHRESNAEKLSTNPQLLAQMQTGAREIYQHFVNRSQDNNQGPDTELEDFVHGIDHYNKRLDMAKKSPRHIRVVNNVRGIFLFPKKAVQGIGTALRTKSHRKTLDTEGSVVRPKGRKK